MYTKADQTSENRSPQQAHASLRAVESPRPEALMQQKMQSLANESKQVDRLQTYQLMANAHAEKQEVAQLQQLANGSEGVMQLKAIKGNGYLTGTVKYTMQNNNGNNSAYLMEAKNITLKNQNVKSLAGPHTPSIDITGWQDLQTLGLTNNAPHYKRMHLLNGELGGSGSDEENLAPGSTDLNNTHFQKVEKYLHNHVLGGGTIDSYEVWAFYRTSALPRLTGNDINTYKSTLYGLHCQYQLDNNTGDSLDIYEGPNTAKAWP